VLKQMRIINAGGFGKQERQAWRATIFNNLVSAFQTIYAAMQEDDTDFEDEECIVSGQMRRVYSWLRWTDFGAFSVTLRWSTPRQILEPRSLCLRTSSTLSTLYGPTRGCRSPF
jgi:hypothetical protein